ncbi:hypothetical protein HYV11_04145 [Candidatus Dependentiae bacterium]|nr:hypothetical protein [Candidatus Dependentiae bacterium]
MVKKVIILSIIFIWSVNLSYAQSSDENKSLFKLGPTPFINKSILSISLSYGANYGSPSFIIQQWILPDNRKKIMFNNIVGSISADNQFEAYIKYFDGYSLAYNYSHIGVKYKNDESVFGIKWKVIDSESYVPDASIELNSQYPISLALGSSSESFKYYLGMDWGLYYIPLPYRYSLGVAYSINNSINIFAEGNYQDAWDGRAQNQSARTGVDLSLLNYVHLDIALFYFGFKFTDIIPGRNGLTWQNPDYIMTMPEKNNYFLLSSSIYINLDLLK